MPSERTGHGDPARTVDLLWGAAARPDGRRGPRPRLAAPAIVAAAVELADSAGIAAVTMRELARRLGLASPNALYTYVPSKAELLDLVVDACFATFELDSDAVPPDIAARVRAIADANRALLRRHPWLAEVATDRPPLGPGQLRKYELELGVLDGLGLTDHEMDFTLTLVTTFVRSHVGSLAGAGSDAEETAWWERAGPALARHADPATYPLGSRVGSAVGGDQGRAVDPDVAYDFGVERIAVGVAALSDS
jgi:AcrR family transcriptional regulator